MSSHNRVHYVKQDQPAFLRKFKEKVGMKPEATVEDKVQVVADDCNDEEKDDEKPVVVVLKEGDLTAEEAADHKDENPITDSSDGKIIFKKPIKRKVDNGLNATTKKSRHQQNTDSSKKKSKKSESTRKDVVATTSSSLLSFEYDD